MGGCSGDHASIHDDITATEFGFAQGAIEGPTHFSQFVPLLATLWGQKWFETGCISVHYEQVCYEGDAVRAQVAFVGDAPRVGQITMEKEDGSRVLSGTASVGPDYGETELEGRLARVIPPKAPRILDRLAVGQKAEPGVVIMSYVDRMGSLYPYSLEEKLKVITEPSPWYEAERGRSSPWGRSVIPLEMLSVLAQYTSTDAFPVREPSVALFIDQEIRLIGGPLFVGQEYEVERDIVALGESRRTESYWVATTLYDRHDHAPVMNMLLHTGVLKESYK